MKRLQDLLVSDVQYNLFIRYSKTRSSFLHDNFISVLYLRVNFYVRLVSLICVLFMGIQIGFINRFSRTRIWTDNLDIVVVRWYLGSTGVHEIFIIF